MRTVNDGKILVQYQKGYKLNTKISTLVSHFQTLSLAGNIIVYTPIQSTNMEK